MAILSRRFTVALVLCLFAFPASRALAWNEVGHKIVSLIAWEDLTPAAKAKVTALLAKHPRYAEDLLKSVPEDTDAETKARRAFAASSIWPDVVRGQSHPMHFVANHPAWHYIDFPYVVGGPATKPATTTAPTTQPIKSPAGKPGEPGDILEALAKVEADLKAPTTSDADKAIAICWLMHLVGDIHQPLHAATMVSADYPEGDKGGNNQTVLREGNYRNSDMNLHAVWDTMLGTQHSDDLIVYSAAGLKQDPKLSRETLRDSIMVKDPAKWAQESHDLAVQYVYLNGTLQTASTAAIRADYKTRIPGLPPGYLEVAEVIAARRVALAGHRAADLLNAIFTTP